MLQTLNLMKESEVELLQIYKNSIGEYKKKPSIIFTEEKMKLFYLQRTKGVREIISIAEKEGFHLGIYYPAIHYFDKLLTSGLQMDNELRVLMSFSFAGKKLLNLK